MENKRHGIVLQGFNVLDVVGFIGRTNKKYVAILLSQIEELIDDEEIYPKLRKLILDSFNNYTREVVNSIFGDINF